MGRLPEKLAGCFFCGGETGTEPVNLFYWREVPLVFGESAICRKINTVCSGCRLGRN